MNKSNSSNSISASTKLLALSALTELGYFIKHLEKSDSVAVNDEQIRVFVKNLIENVSVEENAALAFTMGALTENVNVLDTFATVVSYNRNFNDTFTLDDAALIDKDYYGTKGNVATMSDLLSISHGYGRIFNDTILLSDVENNPVGTGLLNTTLFNPGNSQFALYRGNDQVDTLGISDVAAIGPSKVFADNLSLLASAFSDTIYYGLGKNLSDSANLTDSIWLSLKTFTDTANIAEILANNFYKTLDESSDIINISDTINVVRVTGGVMNMIPLNRVQLN